VRCVASANGPLTRGRSPGSPHPAVSGLGRVSGQDMQTVCLGGLGMHGGRGGGRSPPARPCCSTCDATPHPTALLPPSPHSLCSWSGPGTWAGTWVPTFPRRGMCFRERVELRTRLMAIGLFRVHPTPLTFISLNSVGPKLSRCTHRPRDPSSTTVPALPLLQNGYTQGQCNKRRATRAQGHRLPRLPIHSASWHHVCRWRPLLI
jgi:hypothetical protein